MSSQSNEFDDHDQTPRPSARTELLRAAADGELGAPDEAALRERLASEPRDAEVIAFERRLREEIAGCATSMAPRSLRERVERMQSVHAVESPAATPALRRFPGRSLAWAALAACLAIAAGAVYFLVPGAPALPGPGERISEPHRGSLISFMRGQHMDCEVHAGALSQRFRIDTLERVPPEVSKVVGVAPDLGALAESGVEFLGAAECAVPGRGASAHLVLRSDGAVVSLFVQRDFEELAMDAGTVYWLTPEQSGAAIGMITWRKDGLVYFLVAPSMTGLEAVRTALGAPTPSAVL